MLKSNGALNECDDICVTCYSRLLREFGYKQLDGAGRTVSEIMEAYPHNVLLLRLNGHLTCAKYGRCYDIWDCTAEPVDIFWIVR